MNRTRAHYPAVMTSAIVVLLALTGCGRREQSQSHQESTGTKGSSLSNLQDLPLEDHQTELLKVAFEIASAIPTSTHAKERAKTQDKIVATCLSLGQAAQALLFIEQIENWRRYYGYASLAYYCARQERLDETRLLLRQAEQFDETVKAWRSDRISGRIAQVYALLGQDEQAERVQASFIEEKEIGKLAAAQALAAADGSFDTQLAKINALAQSKNFDILRNALNAYIDLFDRFYDNALHRADVDEQLRARWQTMPLFVRIQLLLQLAQKAKDHGDTGTTLKYVQEAENFLKDSAAPLEFYLSWIGQIVQLRAQAGDDTGSRQLAMEAVNRYEAQKHSIMQIERAVALLPLAEAFHEMGDHENATLIYAKALTEGSVVASSRPKAKDLAVTCSSMAHCGFKPDEQMMQRIGQLQADLGDPW